MSSTFDPYHKWLGIPPSQQPYYPSRGDVPPPPQYQQPTYQQPQYRQPQYQQQQQNQQSSQQPPSGDGANDLGLPSFITGAGPQPGYGQGAGQNFGNGHEQNDRHHDRYNHRRRRRHRGGYRSDRQDFGNQQNMTNQSAPQNMHDAGGDEPHQPGE